MPTYEYQCEGCKSLFDYSQSFSEEPLAQCPLCDAEKPKRLISTPFFVHVKEVKDLMTLAEKNSKKMGKDEVFEREALSQERLLKKKKEAAEKVGGKIPKISDTRPFWRPDSDTPIDLSKISNVRRYIEEGTT